MVTWGSTALVTGASSGIGSAFAGALAARGLDVVLVARSGARLEELAGRLAAAHGVRAEVVVADLGRPDAVEQVRAEVERRGLTIDVLVNNAGFATRGPFEALDPARDHEEVAVNVSAVVDLAHAFLPGMVARGRGTMVNVASTGAFQPVPWMAVYGASKAFVLSFSEALAEEYRGRGVRVLALCPGATETGFFDVVGRDTAVGDLRTPEQVVATALRALERGRPVAVDGFRNTLVAQVPRLLPRALTARIAARAVGRGSAPATPRTVPSAG
jgi:short-subunit dehydrogenase